MPDTRKIIYWDSCVFLSYVNQMPDRMPVLDALMDETLSDAGTIRLFTSSLAHVEVAYGAAEKLKGSLDPAIEGRINGLWANPETVVSVEFHEDIAQFGKELMRLAISFGWSLKPLDAIHLGTAQWLTSVGIVVDEFHTYDKELPRYEPFVHFRIIEPQTPQPRML